MRTSEIPLSLRLTETQLSHLDVGEKLHLCNGEDNYNEVVKVFSNRCLLKLIDKHGKITIPNPSLHHSYDNKYRIFGNVLYRIPDYPYHEVNF